jgi:hypothetical protein
LPLLAAKTGLCGLSSFHPGLLLTQSPDVSGIGISGSRAE